MLIVTLVRDQLLVNSQRRDRLSPCRRCVFYRWSDENGHFTPPESSRRAPNVLTLSCKSRPPCRPPEAARRLPRLTTAVAGANCSRRAAGVQLEPPEGGSAAAPTPRGPCQLVRIVGLRHELLGPLARLSTVHYAQKRAFAVANGGECRRFCRNKLQKPTLPELLPSRCRGRLFDAYPEEREACGGLPPPRPCLSPA